jgi:hypothetical protein
MKLKNGGFLERVLWIYEFQLYRKKESLVYIRIFLVFWYFFMNFMAHHVEIASWRITLIALMVILILSIWTKLNSSSLKEFDGYFTVSLKYLKYFALI